MTLNQEYNFIKRENAAFELVKMHQERFSKIGYNNSRWTYEGSEGETYEVNMILQTCTCKDHTLRNMGLSDQPCKHLIAVSILNLRELRL